MEILETKCRINLSQILCDCSPCVLKFLTFGPLSFLFLELPSLGRGGKCYSTCTMTRGEWEWEIVPANKTAKKNGLFTVLAAWRQEQICYYCCCCRVRNGLERTPTGVLEDRHLWIEKAFWRLNAAWFLLSCKPVWNTRHIWHIVSGNVFMNLRLISFVKHPKLIINRMMRRRFFFKFNFLFYFIILQVSFSLEQF